MDDPRSVRLGHGRAGLQHPVDRFGDGKRAALPQLGFEIAPAQKLHHDERAPELVGIHIEDLHDVRALHAAAGARLSLEALDGVRHGQHLRAKELDGDALAKAQVLGLEDEPHAAFA